MRGARGNYPLVIKSARRRFQPQTIIKDSMDGLHSRPQPHLPTLCLHSLSQEIDERLELRRAVLEADFWEMESILGQLDAESQYLTTQMAALNSNWVLGKAKD